MFPSAHISYEAPGKNHISAAYSYRTNRPGIWQLEPYITYEDYYTRLVGNPDIRPEYIHAAELGYRKSFKNGHSISATAFYRGRKGKTDRIRVAYQPGVTLDSLVNAGNDFTYGLEIDTRLKPLSWWDMTVTGSLYGYRFTSTAEGCSDASNISYTLGLINNFKAGRTTRVQFDANAVCPGHTYPGVRESLHVFRHSRQAAGTQRQADNLSCNA